jgi:hypothetical protein
MTNDEWAQQNGTSIVIREFVILHSSFKKEAA